MKLVLCDRRSWVPFFSTILIVGAFSTLTGCSAAYMEQNQKPAKTLASVTISPQTSEIVLGKTQQFSATATYSDGSKVDVTTTAMWVSTQPNIATVNSVGMVKSKGTGTVSISATYQSAKGSSNLTIDPAALVSIALGPQNPSITPKHSVQLVATGTFTDGTVQDVSSSVSWSTMPAGIITVSNAGLATASAIGTVTVTATKGFHRGSDTVTVAAPVLVSIALSPQSVTLTPQHSGQLTAEGTYNDQSTQDISSSVMWSASPDHVVTIDTNGMVTGASLGTTTVTAAFNNLTASSQVAVVAPTLESIWISPKHVSIPLGENQQLAAVAQYSDGSSKYLKNSVQWSSSDTTILSMGVSGLATGVSLGTASVTATSGTVSGTAQVQVAPAVVTSLAIAPASSMLLVGGRAQLSATAIFSDGSSQDFTTSASWNSADPTIARVTSGGLIVAEHLGDATITASTGSITGSAGVSVKPVMAVSYFSNAHTKFPDGTVRLTNPGITGTNLCAEVYVFDQDQQLTECCGCMLTPDGLQTLSVNTDLTGNPLTGVASINGVLKVIPADALSNPSCDPTAITPTASLSAWSTNIQARSTSSFAVTETSFLLTPLGDDELAALQNQCSLAASLGSGQGVCGCGAGTAAGAKATKIAPSK
jgi:uncharacterized protein YjdB